MSKRCKYMIGDIDRTLDRSICLSDDRSFEKGCFSTCPFIRKGKVHKKQAAEVCKYYEPEEG